MFNKDIYKVMGEYNDWLEGRWGMRQPKVNSLDSYTLVSIDGDVKVIPLSIKYGFLGNSCTLNIVFNDQFKLYIRYNKTNKSYITEPILSDLYKLFNKELLTFTDNCKPIELKLTELIDKVEQYAILVVNYELAKSKSKRSA